MQGPDYAIRKTDPHTMLGCDVVPLFKVLFAQMAAACASIAAALHDASIHHRVWIHGPDHCPAKALSSNFAYNGPTCAPVHPRG
jgi:hypothetical protein